MTELTAWTKSSGPLSVDIETKAGSDKAKLTFTVTTDDGDIHYITIPATALDMWALAAHLNEAADGLYRNRI
jgi:hypothetical protein